MRAHRAGKNVPTHLSPAWLQLICRARPVPELCSCPQPPNTSPVTFLWLRVAQRNFVMFGPKSDLRPRVMIELQRARQAIASSCAAVTHWYPRVNRTWGAAAAPACADWSAAGLESAAQFNMTRASQGQAPAVRMDYNKTSPFSRCPSDDRCFSNSEIGRTNNLLDDVLTIVVFKDWHALHHPTRTRPRLQAAHVHARACMASQRFAREDSQSSPLRCHPVAALKPVVGNHPIGHCWPTWSSS